VYVEVLLIVLLLAAAWYWYDSTIVKERAVAAARRACARHRQQLLDGTVALSRLRPRRDGGGRMRLQRHYRFEFSGDGELRRSGEIILLGQRIIGLNLELDDYTLYDQDEQPPSLH
jgi:hypothetical protein